MYVPHAEFTLPPDHEIIWRYLTLPKFMNLLASSHIFLCRTDRLNDIAEGTFPDKELQAWSSAAQKNNINPIEAEKFLQYFYGFRKSIYVNCWHMANRESSSMWNAYIGDVYGVIIRSNIRRLIKSFAKTKEKLFIGKVRYLDYQNEAPLQRSFYPLYLSKQISFAYENELRVLYSHNENATSIYLEYELPDPGFYTRIDIEQLIECIYVHPGTGQWFADTLKGVIARYRMRWPVKIAQFQ